MNMSNCDGFGLIHRVIKLVEATNLEHGSQDGADGGDTELNGGGGSEMEDLRYYFYIYFIRPTFSLLRICEIYALSFYRSKMILDCPDCFGWVQIILVGSKLLWSGPHNLGQVEIRLFWANFYSLRLSKMIWNRPKQIGTVITIGTYSTEII